MLCDLRGQIERITYSSDETGYTVAKIKCYGRADLVTVVGNIMAPAPGEVLKMVGEWVNHPKFGEQFKVVRYESAVPASVAGIRKYLGSGLIKYIGPVMAKRIVDLFGEKTLDVIEEETDRLLEVEGIGPKRLDKIKSAWEEQKEIREVMVFLQSHGVSSGYATKIFKRYGQESIAVVQDNPYRLATDIFGIGFLTADRIAEQLGFEKTSPLRAQAGVLYVLHQLADEGHVYYPYEPLIDKSVEILEVDRSIITTAIEVIAEDEQIVIEEMEPLAGTDSDDRAVYLTGYHFAEKTIAHRIKTLLNAPRSFREVDAEKAIGWVQDQLSIQLAEKQVEAVKQGVQAKVLVITGGPGTGKTTIINAILKIISMLKVRIMLAAPTGRAAKRMSETTGYEAKTIHRMLEFNLQKGGFQKNEEDPLECDLLIMDEASMIDTLLMHHLLKAVPPSATLILVGDVNQLPSVGPGNVLKDIIASGAVPVVELKEIFRQARDSAIIVNAHRINQGFFPELQNSAAGISDFYFIEQAEPEDILKTLLVLVKDRIPNRFRLDPVDDIQILSPMHRGLIGAGNLNQELQEVLNPGDSGLVRGGRTYRVNDKVMQIRNNYDKEVYNGDIGRITRIDHELQEVKINMDGREVDYHFSDLDEVVLAYAVSVHKSQGSEYPAVIVPVHTPALHAPAEKPSLYRRHTGEGAGCSGWDQEGLGHCRQERQDPKTVYQAQGAVIA